MILIQIKNSIRFLLQKKNYLLINILGLGVGFASFLLLSLYLYNDYTYNHFNKNLPNIYRIQEGSGIQTKGLLLPKLIEQIPEIENGTRIFNWDQFRLSYKETAFQENIHYVDTGFFSVFSFPFIQGSAYIGIHNKYNVVISSEFARKYFGDESPIGKKIRVKFDDIYLTVAGVVAIPSNSSVKFNIITSYDTGYEISPWMKDVHDWYNTFSETYVLLAKGADPNSIDSKLQDIVHKYFYPAGENKTILSLMPFKRFHSEKESNSTLIVILTIIALGIIGIAIVNFINLTITTSLSRTKEIGIKKVMGAHNRYIFIQIISESFMVSLLALIIGGGIAFLLLSSFNQIFNTSLEFDMIKSKFFITLLLSIWLIVGFLSGIIPSIFLAKSQLAENLRGNFFSKKQSSISKYSLIVFQFIIAIILISGTFLMKKQINDMLQTDPKFDKENVIVAELENWQFSDLNLASQKFKRISEEMKSSPYVESVCFSNNIPGSFSENYNTYYTEGESSTESINFRKTYIGRNYFKTYGIKILSGSGFNQETTSYLRKIILNRKAMNMLGFDEATDQTLHAGSKTGRPHTIIGAVEDYNYQGMQRENQPVAHFYSEPENLSDWNYLSIKAKQGASLRVIELLTKKWKEIVPENNVSIIFANDKLNEHYQEYIKINKIIGWFSVLAILLSCTGLYALSSYTMAQRTKEIGIRKVNGAKNHEIMAMLNKDFAKWVAIAFIIACPIGWYAMHKWLENFAYKTELSWWVFALAGLIAMGIALLTVSFQSWRAATRNPVESLRYE